jgi:hypothetical protein
MTIDRYLNIRQSVIAAGFGGDIDWSESLKPPADAAALAHEAIFVICNSGMAWTVGSKVYSRVMDALNDGRSALDALKHPHKSKSIDRIWRDRERLYGEFVALTTDAGRLAWCDRLPHIGGITKYHLAKNLGVNVAKPDRHLERLAKASGETVQGLCERLSREHGDRVATVDVVLWRACACGIIKSREIAA